MEADWDLHAVVRGCTSSSAPPCGLPSSLSDFQGDYATSLPLVSSLEPLLPTRTSAFEELHQLYQPFIPKPEPFCCPNPPLSCSSSSSLSLASSLFQRTKSIPPVVGGHVRGLGFRAATSQGSKSKKRKNTQKKVCEVPAESISSDVWAWRKYGQKPIKGSPFPRSYYRCSSSKGCLARKQVERHRSDDGMFIITYTGEHNHPAPAHRNSLAGVPRQKQAGHCSTTQSEITSRDTNVQGGSSCSSEAVLGGGESPGEEEGTFPSDDFCMGLEGLMGGSRNPMEEHCGFPWAPNNRAAAAAGGGGGGGVGRWSWS
ncbi:hypothetical protein MLD38_010576 [Melastoma candidum]|uniref:Uncharacterized protein n=1 Tax=Melastoma candidum TaxID=119954 RepID=A0ACB9R4D8_9MYRT|nr:hypothetical protein MLD38_010576 [Melastoma candidum]